MKELIVNMFSLKNTNITVGTVQEKIDAVRYKIIIDGGGIVIAESAFSLFPQDRVKVQLGRVVSMAGDAKNIKVYEV